MRGPQHYQFSPNAAKQIAETVRRVEKASRSRLPHRRRSPPASVQGLRRYKLAGTLAAGGSATAYPVIWKSSSYVAQDGTGGQPNKSFTLYSFYDATGSAGDEGYAAYFGDRSVWEAIPKGSQIAIATLGGTLSSGGNVSATYVIGGSGSVTVYDKLLCSGDSLTSGATVVIAQIAGKWYVINAVCPCS